MSHASTSEPSPVQPRSVVLAIHGTFAYDDQDAPDHNGRWWQRGGAFAGGLSADLGPEFDVLPAAESTAGGIPVDAVFHWSGRNSESSRREAGRLLLEHLTRFEREGIHYHVIAHSHGGSVLWEALQAATTRGGRGRTPLPSLQSWTTVGTPFLHFVPDWVPALTGILVLLPMLAVLGRQFAWLRDAVGQLPDAEGAWWAVLGTAILGYAAVILGCAATAFLFYRLFALQAAQRDPVASSDIPGMELRQLGRSLKGAVLIAAILTFTTWTFSRFCNVTEVLGLSFVDAMLLGASLWAMTVIGTSVTAIHLISAPVTQIFACLGKKRRQLKTWGYFGARHYSVFSAEDEAICGLTAIQVGMAGPLLPRIPAPGAGQYSARTHRDLNPEGSPSGGMLSLPFRIIYDWILRPLYNEVFAPLVDSFVLRRLSRNAQGADLAGAMLGQVSTSPLLSKHVSPHRRLRDYFASWFTPVYRGRGPSPETRQIGLSLKGCDAIAAGTRGHADLLLARVRKQLALPTAIATSLADFFRRAMSGDEVSKLLIHTGYFELAETRSLVCDAIQGRARCDSVTSVAARDADPVDADRFWPPRGFGFWLLRGVSLLCLAVLPACFAAALGYLWLYPAARESNLRWAAEAPGAIAAASHNFKLLTQEAQTRRSPSFVRWLAGLEALGMSAEADEFYRLAGELHLTPVESAAIRAAVAQKLKELGESELAEAQLNTALAIAQSSRNDPADPSLVRIRMAETAIRSPAPDDRSEPLGFPDSLGALKAEVSKVLSPEVDGAAFVRIAGALPGITDGILRDVAEPRELFKAVDGLLILHQRSAEMGHAELEAAGLTASRRVCRYLVQSASGDAEKLLLAVEAHVVVAKSQLTSEASRRGAVRWLQAGEAELLEGLPPLESLKARARLGAAYARLGYFRLARQSVGGAAPLERLFVAKEMLANEYETRSKLPTDDHRAEWRNLGRSRRAFDEQVDPHRGELNYPR